VVIVSNSFNYYIFFKLVVIKSHIRTQSDLLQEGLALPISAGLPIQEHGFKEFTSHMLVHSWELVHLFNLAFI
jgi:hypothetical protein